MGETGARSATHENPALRRVFLPSAVIILIVVVFTIAFPGTAESVISSIQRNVIGAFGWYYVLMVAGFVVFALWMGLSRFGDIKLGRDDDTPEFSMRAWFSMLFAAGMGIGLVFWGVAEPLSHYAEPKPGVDGSQEHLAQLALAQTYLHWGIHAWAIYVVIGVALAYAIHRRGRPVSIRWALEPLLGERVKGRLGDVIDITAIVGTLFGVATSLGLGVLQMAAGLEIIDVASSTTGLQVVLIAVVTGIATLSVMSGLAKGLRILSNINVVIAGLLMIFVLVAGPTLFLMRNFVQSIGVYLSNVLSMTFDVTAFSGADGEAWQAAWTTFYWGWWISWAPFVGVFIARISRGRTVREFVAGVLLVPTIVTFLWFAVMGGAAIHREIFEGGGLVVGGEVIPEFALFELLTELPASNVISVLAIILIALFFVTSSDSGSLVLAMLSRGGEPHPPLAARIFWAVLGGAVAIGLLLAGGLIALQTAAILMALPFSVVMAGICAATLKAFRHEHQRVMALQRKEFADDITAQVTGALVDDDIGDMARGPERALPRLRDLFR